MFFGCRARRKQMLPELGSDSTGATFWWVVAGVLLGSVIPRTLGRVARGEERPQCLALLLLLYLLIFAKS